MKSTRCINCFNSMCLSKPKTDEFPSATENNRKMSNITSTSIKIDAGSSSQSNNVDQKLKNIKLDANQTENEAGKSEKKFKIPRNKIGLKPGRSLMDWIRLGTSGKDLTGVNGQFLDVSLDELKKHDKSDDAWLCINGRVYNVTDYNEFHPGGLDEIAKGFGKDATQLFMQAHSWVNYENMLQKCIVGRLVRELVSPIVPKRSLNVQICTQINPITHDWYQSDEEVVIILYTRNVEIGKENIILDVYDVKTVLVTVYCDAQVHYVHYDLEQPIEAESRVDVGSNGKIGICLRKTQQMRWNQLGNALKMNKKCSKSNEKEIRYRQTKLIGRKNVAQNTFLLKLEFDGATKMKIPTAKHVSLKLDSNAELERSYTPIPETLKAADDCEKEGKHFYLMIKTYRDGLLTPFISELELGDSVQISDYFGEFDSKTVLNRDQLVLFAAGTGITPMIGIIHDLLMKSERKILVELVFFNRTERDIVWKNEFELLSEMDERFSVQFVLSDPEVHWTGRRGRICMEFMKEFVENWIENVFFCICGPTPFNQTCNGLLGDVGYGAQQVHVFQN